MKFLKKLSMYICVMVISASVSTIAYAGFTRQYTPRVDGFGIKVATQDNMLISSTGEQGSFKDMVTYDELYDPTNTNLQPLFATVEPTDNEYENLILQNAVPEVVYTSKEANHSNDIVNGDYVAFNLYFQSSSTMNLYLGNSHASNIITIDESATGNSSFLPAEQLQLLQSVRIGFLTYFTTVTQDYNGYHTVYSDSPIKTSVYSVVEHTNSYADYSFTELGYNTSTYQGHVLATVDSEKPVKVKVVIWLEGANFDNSLLDAIAYLKFNIAFEAVKV